MIKNRYLYVNYCKWLCLSIFFTLIDISTKFWIKTYFFIGDTLHIFPGVNCHYINNSGLAFGLFAYINTCYPWIFITIIIAIIITIIIALYNSVAKCLIYKCFSYSIILGGSIGNLYDRILYGTVTDFIDFYIKNWHWPIFNIADLEICIGFLFLISKKHFF